MIEKALMDARIVEIRQLASRTTPARRRLPLLRRRSR